MHPKNNLLTILIAALLLASLPGAGLAADLSALKAPQASIVVNTLDEEYNTDGDCSLREAIAASNFNTPRDACPGGDSSLTDTITFSVSNTITLGTSLPNIQNAGPLVIDGGDNIVISGGDSVRVLYVENDANLTLKNLTVSDGFVGSDGKGAGLYNDGGTLLIDSVTFKGNKVTGINSFGGGIYMDSGQTTIQFSTFENNSAAFGGGLSNFFGEQSISNSIFKWNHADWEGGGIYHLNNPLTVTNCEFNENDSSHGGGIMTHNLTNISDSSFYNNVATSYGGGIYAEWIITVTNTTFDENVAYGHGGAMGVQGGRASIEDCTFDTNFAIKNGGGVFTWALSNLSVSNSYFDFNIAKEGGAIAQIQAYGSDITGTTFIDNYAHKGGAYHGGEVKTTIADSTFVDNFSFEIGGAIYNGTPIIGGTSYMTVTNSTLSENSSEYGGAIYNVTSTLKLLNSTLFSNTATLDGGSLYHEIGSPGSLLVQNSIIDGRGSFTSCGGPISDDGHNIDDRNSCAFDPTQGSLPNTDPLLGPLLDNGGQTLTHALLTGSQAINSADFSLCPTADQRGYNRRIGYCDIGAFEAQPATLNAQNGSGQSAVILSAFADPLMAWVVDAFGNSLGGVGITFTGPSSGPGISSGATRTSDGSGRTSFIPTANGEKGGPYIVTAAAGALSAPFSLTNLGYPTSISITNDSPDPSQAGTTFPVVFQASASQGTPSGDVTVSVQGRGESCTGTLSNGGGSCSLSIPAAGTFTLVATYAGDASFDASSITETHTVTEGPPNQNIYLPLVMR